MDYLNQRVSVAESIDVNDTPDIPEVAHLCTDQVLIDDTYWIVIGNARRRRGQVNANIVVGDFEATQHGVVNDGTLSNARVVRARPTADVITHRLKP